MDMTQIADIIRQVGTIVLTDDGAELVINISLPTVDLRTKKASKKVPVKTAEPEPKKVSDDSKKTKPKKTAELSEYDRSQSKKTKALAKKAKDSFNEKTQPKKTPTQKGAGKLGDLVIKAVSVLGDGCTVESVRDYLKDHPGYAHLDRTNFMVRIQRECRKLAKRDLIIYGGSPKLRQLYLPLSTSQDTTEQPAPAAVNTEATDKAKKAVSDIIAMFARSDDHPAEFCFQLSTFSGKVLVDYARLAKKKNVVISVLLPSGILLDLLYVDGWYHAHLEPSPTDTGENGAVLSSKTQVGLAKLVMSRIDQLSPSQPHVPHTAVNGATEPLDKPLDKAKVEPQKVKVVDIGKVYGSQGILKALDLSRDRDQQVKLTLVDKADRWLQIIVHYVSDGDTYRALDLDTEQWMDSTYQAGLVQIILDHFDADLPNDEPPQLVTSTPIFTGSKETPDASLEIESVPTPAAVQASMDSHAAMIDTTTTAPWREPQTDSKPKAPPTEPVTVKPGQEPAGEPIPAQPVDLVSLVQGLQTAPQMDTQEHQEDKAADPTEQPQELTSWSQLTQALNGLRQSKSLKARVVSLTPVSAQVEIDLVNGAYYLQHLTLKESLSATSIRAIVKAAKDTWG